MVVRLLGTGAADGIPAFLSNTRVSQFARQHGGKDMRTRSAALVDGSLKIDLPPDTLAHIHRDQLDVRDWTALLITHSHADHFAVEELQYGMFPFSNLEYLCFSVYGNATVCAMARERYPNWPIDLVETRSFQGFTHGPYSITSIRAQHVPEEDSLNFLIERDGRTLLYATDTGVWDEETFEFLSGRVAHALVIECTEGGAATSYEGHLDIGDCVRVVERLRGMGFLGDDSRVVTTHHSHNGECTHAELESLLNPHGIEVGFDGMEFEA